MMHTQKCKKCGSEYPFSDEYFCRDGKRKLTLLCKECKRKYNREYYASHLQEAKERHAQYYSQNRDSVLQKQKNYYQENKKRIVARNEEYQLAHKEQHSKSRKKCDLKHRDQYSAQAKKYREEHIDEYRKYQREYYHERYKTDAVWRFSKSVRSNIRDCFKRNGCEKNSKTEELLGISQKEFCNYLLKTYADQYGEEWDGKTPVHIDHITPIASAKSKEDIIALCNYKNLRLLKAEDNLRKGSKINFSI